MDIRQAGGVEVVSACQEIMLNMISDHVAMTITSPIAVVMEKAKTVK